MSRDAEVYEKHRISISEEFQTNMRKSVNIFKIYKKYLKRFLNICHIR